MQNELSRYPPFKGDSNSIAKQCKLSINTGEIKKQKEHCFRNVIVNTDYNLDTITDAVHTVTLIFIHNYTIFFNKIALRKLYFYAIIKTE